MVEIKDGIIEVLVFLDNDVNVSFIMLENKLDLEIMQKLQEFSDNFLMDGNAKITRVHNLKRHNLTNT